MAGVEERSGAVGSDEDRWPGGDTADVDPAADGWSPPPWRSPWTRVRDRVVGPIRPWVAWFGVGRLVGGALSIGLAVAAGWWLLRPAAPPTEALLPYASAPSSAGAPTVADEPGPPAAGPAPATEPPSATTAGPPTTPAVIVVHVAGAVVRPGVVSLTAGARVTDGVAAAGGPAPDADLGRVNLAAPLVDGQQVYVPAVGEASPPIVAAPSAGAPDGAAASISALGPLDLNVATVDQLDDLPGIGPATAEAIVAHRDANGPFATVDDLEAVRGIGPAKLDALRGLVTT